MNPTIPAGDRPPKGKPEPQQPPRVPEQRPAGTRPRHAAPGECDCCRMGPAGADAQLRGIIADQGYALVGITGPDRPCAYTVGLTVRHLPELYMELASASMMGRAQTYLDEAAATHMRQELHPGGRFTAGGEQWQAEPFTHVRLLTKACQFYENPRALQMVRT